MVLFIVVMSFLILKGTLGPVMRRALKAMNHKIETGLAPGDFHSFPLKK